MYRWARWMAVSFLSIGTAYASPGHVVPPISHQEKVRIAKAYRAVSATAYREGVVGLWHLVEECYMTTIPDQLTEELDRENHRFQPYRDQARVCYLEDLATTELAHKWKYIHKDVPLSYPKDDASLWFSDEEASLRLLFYGLLLFDTTEEKDAFLKPELSKFLAIPYTPRHSRVRGNH
ncbi:hypothetical protein AA15669_1907 [Saccharibacter floricola DSM 15669]|uniref:Uncharacterized protein n=1 Tax=Saccharibacter floricola DSM 15669 TaxID=1123227 RepID=A0ABQ0P135_9PROT|nr:hypothetical protein AA15669_1907 [Saccharibacter floricola DSM 15669]